MSNSYDYESGDVGGSLYSASQDDDRIEIGGILVALWRRKWLILGISLLGALLTYLIMVQITPKYTARASVMLDSQSVQVLESDNVVSDLNLKNPVLDTEVVVLGSNMLLERVIASLDPKLLEPLDPANRQPGVITRVRGTIAGWVGAAKTMIVGPAAAPAAPELDEDARRMRRMIGALRSSTMIWREGNSYLMSVAVETEDPGLSTLLANSIVETYIRQKIEQRTEVIHNATQFLQDRVDVMRVEVEAAESRIEDFRARELAQTGLSMDTVEQQLLELSTQLALAQADLAQARARYDQIQSVVDTKGIEQAAEVLSSPFVLSLRQQLSEANRRDVELSTRHAEDHPDRVALRKQIELLQWDLVQEVQQIVATLANDVEVARSRATSIQSSVREMEGRAAEMSRAGLELRQLQREADALRESYQTMLNRLNETRSMEQLQRAGARQVERAVVPGGPSSPRVLLFSAFGGTVGFAIGIVVTFLLIVSNVGFRSAREIEQEIGLPVIVSLLKVKWTSTRAMLLGLTKSSYQPFAERLRQLRMALVVRSGTQADGVAVMLTSSVADEGKTSTALALARLEVLAKRSCIVLDFDLRQSRLAADLGYAAPSDLAGVLLDKAPLDDAIYAVPDLGFDLITLNEPAPHLVDVTDVARLKGLIAELKKRYDMVLIDTAPLLLVSDTLRLAPLADQAVLLVRQNTTRRRAVVEAARKLEDLGARSISVAISMTDPRSEQDAYGVYAAYGHAGTSRA